MEPRLIDVDQKVKLIDAEDPELDSLRAAVASLRTRHITLESQACRYKQKLEVNVMCISLKRIALTAPNSSSTGHCRNGCTRTGSRERGKRRS